MKVFKLLHKLDSQELGRFKKFLSSPLFNQRKDLALLFAYWIKVKGRSQASEFYWKKLYPKESFHTSKWHLLTSRLFKLLEEFLAIEEMRHNPVDKRFYLLKVYRKKQEEKLFKTAVQNTALELEKQQFRNKSYLQATHDLAYEKYDYIISGKRKEKTNLQEVSDYFDTYFISTKLRQACYALSRQIINQEQYDLKMVAEVIAEVQRHPIHLKVPAIAIYYYCYQAIASKDNESYFSKLREAIRKFQQYFPPTEMRDIYTVAINYSIRKLNTGNQLFIREAFELYQLSLAQGFLVEEGIMQDSTYINLTSLACKQTKYQWAIDFITTYRKDLKLTSQVPLYHFCLGRIYYEQGSLEDSLKQLIKVDAKASYIFLGARVLQLKIYYELNEIDPLESLIESIRVYLQRSKDLAYRKVHYSNIITFTKLLLQMPAMSKEEKMVFRDRVRAAETFGEKDWFLEKIGK